MRPNLMWCDVDQRLGTTGRHSTFFLAPDAVYRGRISKRDSPEGFDTADLREARALLEATHAS
jgi:hypothetical protein